MKQGLFLTAKNGNLFLTAKNVRAVVRACDLSFGFRDAHDWGRGRVETGD